MEPAKWGRRTERLGVLAQGQDLPRGLRQLQFRIDWPARHGKLLQTRQQPSWLSGVDNVGPGVPPDQGVPVVYYLINGPAQPILRCVENCRIPELGRDH